MANATSPSDKFNALIGQLAALPQDKPACIAVWPDLPFAVGTPVRSGFTTLADFRTALAAHHTDVMKDWREAAEQSGLSVVLFPALCSASLTANPPALTAFIGTHKPKLGLLSALD